MTIFKKFRRASPFEEFAGLLKELFEQDGDLIALISEIHLVLPLDMEESLRPLIGQRLSILMTDLPEKPYIFRVIAQEENRVGGIWSDK